MQGRGFQKEALRQPPAGGAPQTLTPMGQATVLRAQHLSRLATWASATVPPLGALLGARLGCWCEAVGAPAPPSPHVTCERSNFFILLIHLSKLASQFPLFTFLGLVHQSLRAAYTLELDVAMPRSLMLGFDKSEQV